MRATTAAIVIFLIRLNIIARESLLVTAFAKYFTETGLTYLLVSNISLSLFDKSCKTLWDTVKVSTIVVLITNCAVDSVEGYRIKIRGTLSSGQRSQY